MINGKNRFLFIIGLPYETKQSIEETFKWVSSTDLTPSFQPLSIFSDSLYKSEFEKNIDKYGYNIDANTRQWSNEFFTQQEAEQLAKEYNNKILYKDSRVASWFLLTLLNHNLSIDDCKNLKTSEINWKRVLLARSRKIAQYKKLVLKS